MLRDELKTNSLKKGSEIFRNECGGFAKLVIILMEILNLRHFHMTQKLQLQSKKYEKPPKFSYVNKTQYLTLFIAGNI